MFVVRKRATDSMDFWIWLLSVLETEVEVPRAYGWFHILCIILVGAFTAFLCIKMRDCSDKAFRRFCLVIFIVLIVADLYRQIVFDFVGYDAEAGKFIFSYGWYAFPFQLCSSPHYILPFIIWMKDGKVRDACISFMCFFSALGGLTVFLYPGTCFTYCLGVNIQTMLHHGMQIALGVFFAVRESKRLNIKYFALGIPVFLSLAAVAILLNYVVHHAVLMRGVEGVFDMFYISPYYDSGLPVISTLKAALPYPIFLLVYLIGITAGAFLIYLILKYSIKGAKRFRNKTVKCN